MLNFTLNLAQKAGKIMLKNAKKSYKIEEKKKNDFVTEVDKKVEKFVIKEIKKAYPDHKFLGEESSFEQGLTEFSEYQDSQYIWIIDPIDGTNNFIRGLEFYCISIALFRLKKTQKSKNFEYLEGELVLGIIHAPALNKTYHAIKGKGAFLNKKPITVSPEKSLERSIFSTGFHGDFKISNIPYFKQIITRSQGIRRMGSAALDLCHVAEGKIEGYWEFGLHPWDIAAGALIVEEAGGKVTDTNGNLLDLFGKDILASNKKIHKETVEIFTKV
jgi:myo-inositol-1(or 4)-monophosphatase